MYVGKNIVMEYKYGKNEITFSLEMIIANINYQGRVVMCDKINFIFSPATPCQCIIDCGGYKLIIFPSLKCRIMGVRLQPLDRKVLDFENFKVIIDKIQSVTWSGDLQTGPINLSKLYTRLGGWSYCMYEPDLFSGARLKDFNPLCVNVFSSGKCVIMGRRSIDPIDELIEQIRSQLQS